MFSFFRKPSLDSKKATARLQALQNLSSSDPALRDTALNDTDLEVRLAALDRINDIDTLITAYNESAGQSAQLQTQVLDKLATLCPKAADHVKLSEIHLPHAQIDTIALKNSSPAIRWQAANQTGNYELLKRLAVDDSSSLVRQLALERTQDLNVAEKIIEKYKGKDKTLTRQAEKLRDQLRVALEAKTAMQNALEQMQTLAAHPGIDLNTFAHAERQWQQHHDTANAEQKTAWADAYERAQQQLKAESQARAARNDILKAARELLSQVQNQPYLSPEDSDNLLENIADLQSQWQSIGSGKDPDSLRIERECNQTIEQLQHQYQTLNENYQRTAAQRIIIDDIDTLLGQTTAIKATDLQRIKKRWQQSDKVSNNTLQSKLNQHFYRKFDKLEAKKIASDQAYETDLATLQSHQAALTQAIDAEQLQPALTARDQIQTLINESIGLDEKTKQKAQQHLQHHRPAIEQLRGWARWGGHQAREHIIAELQAATAEEKTASDIVKTLKSARAQWKKLNETMGYAPKHLHKAFEDACNELHKPVKAESQKRSADQQQAMEKRLAIIEALEQIETETDWRRYNDWATLNKTLQQHQQNWQQCGGVDRKQWESLNTRYQTVRKSLQERLSVPLERELNRRRQLIKKAQSLAEHDDPIQAMEQVKTLRTEWKPQLTTKRSIENQLWREFNEACNAVFEKSKVENQAIAEEKNEQLQTLQAQLDELQALKKIDHWQDVLANRSTFDALQQSYAHQASIDHPTARKLQQQWEKTSREITQRIRDAELAKRLVMLDGALQVAQTLQAREQATINGDTSKAAQCYQEALTLCDIYPDHTDCLSHRMQERANIAADDEALATRCLTEEIIAQVPSPDAYQAQRRELQVSLLADYMTQTISDEQKLAGLEQRIIDFISEPTRDAAHLYERFTTAINEQLSAHRPTALQLKTPKPVQTTADHPLVDEQTATSQPTSERASDHAENADIAETDRPAPESNA